MFRLRVVGEMAELSSFQAGRKKALISRLQLYRIICVLTNKKTTGIYLEVSIGVKIVITLCFAEVR